MGEDNWLALHSDPNYRPGVVAKNSARISNQHLQVLTSSHEEGQPSAPTGWKLQNVDKPSVLMGSKL